MLLKNPHKLAPPGASWGCLGLPGAAWSASAYITALGGWPSKTEDTPPRILMDPYFRKGFARLRAYGLTFEGWVFHTHIDDLTDLVAAQRSAAWGDVARRVAHEVKNPLTPIKLAAERLKKYFFSLSFFSTLK